MAPRLAALCLALMVSAYGLAAGRLALYRHWNLESQALDMGYADQITWNMAQGRPFRFTVFRGQVGAEFGRPLQLGPGADRDSLLAYHVELLFAPLALLYLVRPGPETLIVVLTAVLALGAVPTYLLARRHLGSRAAGLAFAAVYLLYPSVQGANLSDFHLVSMAPTFLLWGLWLLEERRYRSFAAVAILSAFLKEEVGLLVAMMGLYVWLRRGQRRLGLGIVGASCAWVALCFLVIIPRFSGGAPSLFAARYAGAIAHLRGWPAALAAGRLDWPVPGFTVGYVLELAASTGFLALLAPFELALAAPAVAINGLSSSAWQHGGGAHYSAEAVPGFLFAAILAVRRVSDWTAGRLRLDARGVVFVLSLVAVTGALVQSRQHGILPPARRYVWPEASGRLERLRPLLARIPAGAPVSAQSNVFPHLSNRERVYVFPAIEDARFVLVDVAGTSDPLYPDELYTEASVLLASGRYVLLDANDGFVLFERLDHARPLVGSPASPPPPFFTFTRPADEGPGAARAAGSAGAPLAQFDDLFEVIGFHAEPVPEVSFVVRRAIPTLYVRARRPAAAAFRFTTFRLGQDGLARIHDDGNPTQLWRPTYRWEAGDTLRLRYPPLTYSPGEQFGVGVQRGVETEGVRLRISGGTVPVTDGDRVAILGRLP